MFTSEKMLRDALQETFMLNRCQGNVIYALNSELTKSEKGTWKRGQHARRVHSGKNTGVQLKPREGRSKGKWPENVQLGWWGTTESLRQKTETQTNTAPYPIRQNHKKLRMSL